MKYYIKEVYLNAGNKDLEAFQKELEACITSVKERLLMLAAATPRTVVDSEGTSMDWNDHVQFEVSQMLDELDEYIGDRRLAVIALSDMSNVDEVQP